MAPIGDNLRGKRVLVTGDTGFKGAWLSLALHDAGAEVHGFALPPAGPDSLFDALGLASLIGHIDGDLRDIDAVTAAVAAARPQIVFHLAAQSLVRRGYAEPKITFDTNVGGSVNLLEALRAAPDLQALVFVTTDKCYENREWVWGYRENDRLGGHDPYAASKAAAEIVFAAYARSFFADRPAVGLASARAGNVIGGGDWAEDRLIPDIVRAFSAGQPARLRSPDATRPWQHVLDCLDGYLVLAGALVDDPAAHGGAWNFGPEAGDTRTVRTVAGDAAAIWGDGKVVEESGGDHPREAMSLQLSIEKARHRLGWQPRWDVTRALAETVSWYRDVAAGRPAPEVTRGQIRAYAETTP